MSKKQQRKATKKGKSKEIKIGRDAKTGEFLMLTEAKAGPIVREHIVPFNVGDRRFAEGSIGPLERQIRDKIVHRHNKQTLSRFERIQVQEFIDGLLSKGKERSEKSFLERLSIWNGVKAIATAHTVTHTTALSMVHDELQKNKSYRKIFRKKLIPKDDLDVIAYMDYDAHLAISQTEKFTSEISHALKNPLQPITLYIDPGEADPEDITEFYHALNDLYRHLGGTSNLKFVNEGCKSMVGEFA